MSVESVLIKEVLSDINYNGDDVYKIYASRALQDLLSECAKYQIGSEKFRSPHTEHVVSSKEKTLELMKICIHYNMNNLLCDTMSLSEIIKKCYIFQNECVKFLTRVHPEFTDAD